MKLAKAMDWASGHKHAVLITLRSDGRAQSSDIIYLVEDGAFLISVTDDRAKTTNMRRDNRVVLHISEPQSWSYLSFDATVELSPTAVAPDDEAADALVDLYRRLSGEEHPDWDEYRQAMVDEQRLIARVVPTSAVGQVH